MTAVNKIYIATINKIYIAEYVHMKHVYRVVVFSCSELQLF
jgi:hypothetical protein